MKAARAEVQAAFFRESQHRLSERERYALYPTLFCIIGDLEAEFATHFQHYSILGKHEAVDLAQTDRSGIFDKACHQEPAKAETLQPGTHQDGVFSIQSAFIVQTRDSQKLAGGFIKATKAAARAGSS